METDGACRVSIPSTLRCEDVKAGPDSWQNLVTNSTHSLVLTRTATPKDSLRADNMKYITTCYITDSEEELGLGGGSFESFANLKYLTIKNNTWGSVKSNTFRGLSSLEVLVVIRNGITELESEAFDGLTNLLTMELTFNAIRVLPAFIFKSKSLTSLYLEHNNLQTLERGCLDNLHDLELLDLSHNRIQALDASHFDQLDKLAHLYISSNRIETIEGAFQLPNLSFLSLKGNKLGVISQGMFGSLPALKSLDLSSNQISAVDDRAFSNLPELTLLTVSGNNECGVFGKLKLNRAKALLVC